MDSSEKYIKMCEQAKEIQEQWKTRPADFYMQIEWDEYDKCDYEKFHYLDEEPIQSMSVVEYVKNRSVWLPRQDQLQDMVKEKDMMYFLNKFWAFLFMNFGFRNDFWWNKWTMEQLWLAFVMKENHNKIWDDKKQDWIAIN